MPLQVRRGEIFRVTEKTPLSPLRTANLHIVAVSAYDGEIFTCNLLELSITSRKRLHHHRDNSEQHRASYLLSRETA